MNHGGPLLVSEDKTTKLIFSSLLLLLAWTKELEEVGERPKETKQASKSHTQS